MSADSEKPNIIGGNWTKSCTVAKSVGRGRPIWTSVVVRARVACALRPVQSIPVAIFLNHDAQSAAQTTRFDFVSSYLKAADTFYVGVQSDQLLDHKSMLKWMLGSFLDSQLNWPQWQYVGRHMQTFSLWKREKKKEKNQVSKNLFGADW